VEYAIEKPSIKLLALAELDSNTWVSEVKRIWGKKQPLTAAPLRLAISAFCFPNFSFSAGPPALSPPKPRIWSAPSATSSIRPTA
jgi:hypothetical protein